MNEEVEIVDLGDAKEETKQVAPIPPFYLDSVFGTGSRPDGFEE